MAIVSSDLKILLSGGAANSDVNASLGGAKSSVEVTDNSLHNLFDIISGTEGLAGDTEYRCVYLHNGHGSLTAQATHIYISSNTTSTDDTWDMALDLAGLNATADDVVDENTAPSPTLTFTAPTTYAGGLNMGNIPSGQHYAIWFRRTVGTTAAAIDNNSITIKYDCDTAA